MKEKVNLPFTMRRFLVGHGKDFQKITLENEFDAKNDQLLCIFKCKRLILLPRECPCRYIINLKPCVKSSASETRKSELVYEA